MSIDDELLRKELREVESRRAQHQQETRRLRRELERVEYEENGESPPQSIGGIFPL